MVRATGLLYLADDIILKIERKLFNSINIFLTLTFYYLLLKGRKFYCNLGRECYARLLLIKFEIIRILLIVVLIIVLVQLYVNVVAVIEEKLMFDYYNKLTHIWIYTYYICDAIYVPRTHEMSGTTQRKHYLLLCFV